MGILATRQRMLPYIGLGRYTLALGAQPRIATEHLVTCIDTSRFFALSGAGDWTFQGEMLDVESPDQAIQILKKRRPDLFGRSAVLAGNIHDIACDHGEDMILPACACQNADAILGNWFSDKGLKNLGTVLTHDDFETGLSNFLEYGSLINYTSAALALGGDIVGIIDDFTLYEQGNIVQSLFRQPRDERVGKGRENLYQRMDEAYRLLFLERDPSSTERALENFLEIYKDAPEQEQCPCFAMIAAQQLGRSSHARDIAQGVASMFEGKIGMQEFLKGMKAPGEKVNMSRITSSIAEGL